MYRFRLYRAGVVLILAYGGSSAAAEGEVGSMDVTILPEDCIPLVEHTQKAKESAQFMGLGAGKQVSAGEQTLEEESCLADIKDLEFDFFSGISSIKSAAIKQLWSTAKDEMMNMACDAVDEVRAAAETALTCDAAAGVQFDVGAGFDDIGADECLNQGQPDLNYDAGEFGVGDSNYSAPFDGEFGWGVDGEDALDGESQEDDDAGSWDGWFE